MEIDFVRAINGTEIMVDLDSYEESPNHCDICGEKIPLLGIPFSWVIKEPKMGYVCYHCAKTAIENLAHSFWKEVDGVLIKTLYTAQEVEKEIDSKSWGNFRVTDYLPSQSQFSKNIEVWSKAD